MHNTSPYRVVQWTTGNVGKSSVQAITANPTLELVGCYAWSDSKSGRDVGELVGIEPLGVTATNDIDALLALKPDCVVYNPMWNDVDELVRILSAGVNVVASASFITGQNLGEGRARIEEACKSGGSTMFGSGVSPGFAELLAWIDEQRPGPRVLAAVEGTRSYGLALCRELARAGHTVVEVEQPTRRLHRNGKSDPIDAGLAIEQMLRTSVEQANTPRADGLRDALRMLLNARTELTVHRTVQCNRLHHLLLAGDDTDRDLGKAKFTVTTLTAIIRRRHAADGDLAASIHRSECRRIAQAVRDLGLDLNANETQLRRLLDTLAPGLLELPGIGPVSAAAAVVAFSHPGRLRNDAAFAALAGTCPIPASSGKTVRHRLNRGGDRQLNSALHTIARSRLRYDPKTRAYADRRRAEGKTEREILRCLKRYITRQLYRELTTRMATTA